MTMTRRGRWDSTRRKMTKNRRKRTEMSIIPRERTEEDDEYDDEAVREGGQWKRSRISFSTKR